MCFRYIMKLIVNGVSAVSCQCYVQTSNLSLVIILFLFFLNLIRFCLYAHDFYRLIITAIACTPDATINELLILLFPACELSIFHLSLIYRECIVCIFTSASVIWVRFLDGLVQKIASLLIKTSTEGNTCAKGLANVRLKYGNRNTSKYVINTKFY